MKKAILTAIVAVATFSLSFGQTSIPTVAFTGKTVKDIINELEQTGRRLMQDGQTAGNGVASKFGNEIFVATQNMDYYFGKNTDKVFTNLKIEEQNLFVELNKMIESFNQLNTNITTVSELTNLDLIEFTNRINLITKKLNYYVSSVKGTTIIYGDADFKIAMTGLGFGLNDSRQEYKTTVKVNGNAIAANNIDLTQRRTMVINIPNSVIKSLFQEKKISYLPIVITSEISHKNWIGMTKKETYNTHFNLVLMPSVAGFIIVGETTSQRVLDGHNVVQSISRSFQGCKTDNPCEMVEEWSCSVNQKITGVRYDCSGQCGWSYNKRRGGYDPDYDILNDGRTAKVYRHLDGGNPTTVTYYVDYQNYTDQFNTTKNDTVFIRYNEPVDVSLNPNNSDCNYSLNGKLFTGQTINYNNNTISSSPYFKLLGVGKVGNICKATFKLTTP
jgi:hypothetical protein